MDKAVTIYSTPTCHFCHMTKDFLTEHKVPFTDYNVAADLGKRQEMIQKSGQMGVPVIFIGDPSDPSGQGKMIIGFDKEAITSELGIAV